MGARCREHALYFYLIPPCSQTGFSIADACVEGDVSGVIQVLSATGQWTGRCRQHRLDGLAVSFSWEPLIRSCLTAKWQPLTRLCTAVLEATGAQSARPYNYDWWSLTRQVRWVLDVLVETGDAETGPIPKPGKRRQATYLWRCAG